MSLMPFMVKSGVVKRVLDSTVAWHLGQGWSLDLNGDGVADSTTSVNQLGTPSNPVTDAAAARPTGLTRVYWMCATQPTNWVANDEWIQL